MHGSKLALTVWFSDGHPFQRHLRPATAETTGARFVQDGVAARRPASPRHGGARPLAAEGLGRDRRDRNPQRQNPPEGGPGRSRQGKMLVAGAVEVHDNRPGRVRLALIADFSAASLHAFVNTNGAAAAVAKTDGWATPALPALPTIRTSSDRWRIVLGASPLRQPQTLGAAILPRRVRVPLYVFVYF